MTRNKIAMFTELSTRPRISYCCLADTKSYFKVELIDWFELDVAGRRRDPLKLYKPKSLIFAAAISFRMNRFHEQWKHHEWLLPIVSVWVQYSCIDRLSCASIAEDCRQLRDNTLKSDSTILSNVFVWPSERYSQPRRGFESIVLFVTLRWTCLTQSNQWNRISGMWSDSVFCLSIWEEVWQ